MERHEQKLNLLRCLVKPRSQNKQNLDLFLNLPSSYFISRSAPFSICLFCIYLSFQSEKKSIFIGQFSGAQTITKKKKKKLHCSDKSIRTNWRLFGTKMYEIPFKLTYRAVSLPNFYKKSLFVHFHQKYPKCEPNFRTLRIHTPRP